MDYLLVSKNAPENFVLVDVRNAPPHIKKVKIQGAVEIPLCELEVRLSELSKEKIIVVYCWDVWCNMAAQAALLLIEKGYQTKELIGGIAAWQSMNLATEDLV
jgi:rhodanese-related sulfurtransferase